jgi:hypothetical protein
MGVHPFPNTFVTPAGKRLYTLFQLPYTSGNKRHWAPLRAIRSTPSTKRRRLASFPT